MHMVADLVRDSSFGQLVNWLSDGRYCPYADQKPGYVIPERYLLPPEERRAEQPNANSAGAVAESASTGVSEGAEDEPSETRGGTLVEEPDFQESKDAVSELSSPSRASSAAGGTDLANRQKPRDSDVAEKGEASGTKGEVATDGNACTEYPWLVNFEENDPDRPLNWSSRKRWYCGFLVGLQTLAVYIGSAIYTPAIPGVMEHFNCSRAAATAGLTLFVSAYGIAPMFLSPLQEFPSWGRNPVYIVGFAIFLILQIPCILAPNLAVLLVFRFLSSFAGAPCLATGGASMGDLFGAKYLSVAIGAWCKCSFSLDLLLTTPLILTTPELTLQEPAAIAAICGPIFGPVSSSFAAQLENWRWPFLELVWFGGVVFPLVFFSLPETLESTVLVRRARRLRKLTGNDKLRAPAELDGSMEQTIPAMMGETIHRAFRLALEPSLLVCHLYTALIYSIMYLWFEAFPILWNEMHGYGIGGSGLFFLAFIVATLVIVSVLDPSFTGDILAEYQETVPSLLRLPSPVFPAATRKASRHSSRGPTRIRSPGGPLCSDCTVLVRMDRTCEHSLVSTGNFLSFVCHLPTEADHTPLLPPGSCL